MKIWIAAAIAAIALGAAAPHARADDSDYLNALSDKYFYQELGPQVLLSEGYKVCDDIDEQGDDEMGAINMVKSDLSVSDFAAGEIVGAAMAGLGC
ncbi:DUF732 domain-containing protein [Mycobacterium sp. SM1]|nr:DUF732 domain-containing protein [Mycobacterium sp. SM1]